MKRININTPYYKNVNTLNHQGYINETNIYEVVFNTKIKKDDLVIVIDFIDPEFPIEKHLKSKVWLWKSEPDITSYLKSDYINQFGLFLTNRNRKDIAIPQRETLSPICFQSWIQDKNTIPKNMNIYDIKTKNISLITSNHMIFGLHPYRFDFALFLKNQKINIVDIFGLDNKIPMELGLLNYKYTIVLENTLEKNLWSEKLTDAMRMKCFIFYYGCNNIEKYFDERAIIRIDIKDKKKSLDIIKKSIDSKLFEKNHDAIEINYNIALNLNIYNYINNTVNALIKSNTEILSDSKTIFTSTINKPRTRNSISYKIFLKGQTYVYGIKKIYKMVRLKLFPKFQEEENKKYSETYKSIR